MAGRKSSSSSLCAKAAAASLPERQIAIRSRWGKLDRVSLFSFSLLLFSVASKGHCGVMYVGCLPFSVGNFGLSQLFSTYSVRSTQREHEAPCQPRWPFGRLPRQLDHLLVSILPGGIWEEARRGFAKHGEVDEIRAPPVQPPLARIFQLGFCTG